MLLAVMLVVAMIPLSASAAALPTLEYISVDSKTVQASGTNLVPPTTAPLIRCRLWCWQVVFPPVSRWMPFRLTGTPPRT